MRNNGMRFISTSVKVKCVLQTKRLHERIYQISSLFHFKGIMKDAGGDHKMVLVVRNDLKMGKGKIAAQVCVP